MDFYVVIPARYDSSRFPGKVLTQIGDKTMLEHVYLNASQDQQLQQRSFLYFYHLEIHETNLLH